MWLIHTQPWLDWAADHLLTIGEPLELWLIGGLDFAQADTGLHGIWWPAPRTVQTHERRVYGLDVDRGIVEVHCVGKTHTAQLTTYEQAITNARHGPHLPLLSIWSAVRNTAAQHPQYLDRHAQAVEELARLRRHLPDASHVDHLVRLIETPPDPVLLRV